VGEVSEERKFPIDVWANWEAPESHWAKLFEAAVGCPAVACNAAWTKAITNKLDDPRYVAPSFVVSGEDKPLMIEWSGRSDPAPMPAAYEGDFFDANKLVADGAAAWRDATLAKDGSVMVRVMSDAEIAAVQALPDPGVPASLRPGSRVTEIAAELAATEPEARPDLPYPGASHVAAARIAELEAKVQGHNAATASLCADANKTLSAYHDRIVELEAEVVGLKRAAIFISGRCPRTAVKDNIVTTEELTALGWAQDVYSGNWRAPARPGNAEQAFINNSVQQAAQNAANIGYLPSWVNDPQSVGRLSAEAQNFTAASPLKRPVLPPDFAVGLLEMCKKIFAERSAPIGFGAADPEPPAPAPEPPRHAKPLPRKAMR
jgi:hypothetical protein